MNGTLYVVGLGPGDHALLTPQARAALERSAAVVGYGTYLDLAPPQLLAGKTVYQSGMKKEMDRVAQAVAYCREGMDTALVSSGDAGVYGMAGLALEHLEREGLLDAVPCEVVPGVPALCAVAALLGAPLTHDFAVVSLSDLLTPAELIFRRVEAAAGSDFVLVLYNPRSRRREGLLRRALDTVARHRDPATPVGMVKNAYRQGQELVVTTLAAADDTWADMLTLVLVGNSQTRLAPAPGSPAGTRMITPRGYYAKYGNR